MAEDVPNDQGREAALRILHRRGYSNALRRKRTVAARQRQLRTAEFSFAESEISKSGDVKAFQRFYGLEPTGEIDTATAAMIFAPHCGVPDPPKIRTLALATAASRKLDLSYSFEDFQHDVKPDLVRSVFAAACRRWSDAAEVTFVPVTEGATMRVAFTSFDHGDGFSFDGRGGEVGHAYAHGSKPRSLAGQIHFDGSEIWSFAENCPPTAKDFLSVAIHELGHVLGLDHVERTDSVMFAQYNGVARELTAFDRQTISAMFP